MLGNTKNIMTGVCIFLFMAVGMVASAGAVMSSLAVDIPVPEYVISESNGQMQVELPGFGCINEPGKPQLPSRIFAVAIPPGAVYESIAIDPGHPIQIDIQAEIPAARGFRIISRSDSEKNRQNDMLYQQNSRAIYSSDDMFPSSIVEFERTAAYRNYNLVDIRVTPFQYQPSSGKLWFYPELRVHIRYNEGDQTSVYADEKPTVLKMAREFIVNIDQAQTWYAPLPQSRDTYDFVIITTSALESSVTSLANWETIKGRSVQVVTVEWINSNYTGTDLAQKMRNFLREKYPAEQWGIEDVLFVGHHNNVPMRLVDPDLGYGSPRTDFYFAELSLPDNQSWDSNSNGQYADSGDAMDFYSEINVGRIPWSDAATVQHVCQKSIDYEMNDDDSYKKNMLLLGAYFWDDTDNAVLMERKINEDWMSDWTFLRMYEKNSGYWSTYDCDYPLIQANVVEHWSAGQFAFVNWAGHGSEVSAHILGLGSPAFIEDTDCAQLNDDYPAIIFADACSNSDTSYTNIGAKMIQRGAVGFVGSTQVALGCPGWTGPTSGSSQSLDYYFTTGCTSYEYNQGAAHQRGMRQVYQNSGWDDPAYEMCEWSLWGNPGLGMANSLSSDGRIMLDKSKYTPVSQINITVKDLDLNQNSGSIETTGITVETSRGDTESITLTETGPATSMFMGSIASLNGNPVSGNGSLEVADQDIVTAIYIDEDNGQGGFNIEKTANATIDGQFPIITNVHVTDTTDHSIEIQWTTNEESDSRVMYGEAIPDILITETGMSTSHSVVLEELDACTEYFFYVQSSDPAGNMATDDNGGVYYSEVTYDLVVVLSADMNTNPGWQISGGDWAWGQPMGNGGQYGNPDPTSGYTGQNVYGYNLNGDYANSIPERYLTTPALDCSQYDDIKLRFWRWLGVETDTYDHARVRISTNGTTWTTIWENDGEVSDSNWTFVEYDISAYADHQQTVYLRWVMGPTDTAWQFCGWNIDDVTVTSSQPCGGVPTRTPTIVPTSTPTGMVTPTPTRTPTRTPTMNPSSTPTRTPTPTQVPPSPTRTPTAGITQTQTPTEPPHDTVTPTPYESTHTATPIPTDPEGTATQTPVQATPTSTPDCTELATELWMPSHHFAAGDVCACKVIVCNPDDQPITDLPLFVILGLGGSYFFAPSFTDYDAYDMTFGRGLTEVTVLSEFSWPVNSGSMEGAVWYSAFTDPGVTQIMGRMDDWIFGWE